MQWPPPQLLGLTTLIVRLLTTNRPVAGVWSMLKRLSTRTSGWPASWAKRRRSRRRTRLVRLHRMQALNRPDYRSDRDPSRCR